jgi:CRISPR-associated protein Csb1
MGSWDSQMTQIKKARMFWSVIEAFDVSTLTRRSQLIPPVDYRNEGLIKGDYDMDEFSGAGLSNVPSTKPDVGGVIVHGKIRRQMSVQFEAIRKLRGDTEEETLALRRYILGLCLVLFTVPVSRTLRSGCTLVRKSPDACTTYMGYSDCTRVPFTYSHDEILAYATDAAQAFGVGPDQEVAFDSESVEAHMIAQAAKKEAKKAKKNGKGKGKTPVEEAVQIPVVDEDEEASSEE